MGKWIVIQNAPGYLRENDARRGRRAGGRHKGDWQPGGGVLPIHRSGDGRRSALLRILSSLSPDLCGTSRCGRSFPPAPGRLSPRRLDDWNIVASNRFVQCNVHMEDMRIAQRGWPSAVPTMDGADPVAVTRRDAASRFCRHPLLRSLKLAVRSAGCERAMGASIFPLIR
jgi:hypothetical protein